MLLQLLKKKQKTQEIQLIDVHQQESSSDKIINDVHQCPANCVHFAQQEDDSDLAVSSPVKVVRKHLGPKLNSASACSVSVRGLNEYCAIVRFIYLIYLIW